MFRKMWANLSGWSRLAWVCAGLLLLLFWVCYLIVAADNTVVLYIAMALWLAGVVGCVKNRRLENE